MYNLEEINNIRLNWARDLSKDMVLRGELYDVDVINQSIELILTTNYGERLFLPSYGSVLSRILFSLTTDSSFETLLSTIIEEIGRWEDRITIDTTHSQLIINDDLHTVTIVIPYSINGTIVKGKFVKVVSE